MEVEAVTAYGERTFICPRCSKPGVGDLVGFVYLTSDDVEDADAEYALTQCPNCQQPLLQVREDLGQGFDDDEPRFAFPEPRRLNPLIPLALRSEWEEADKCLSARAYTAAAVMVRRTLEGAVHEQGVNKRNLSDGLRSLRAEGRIDGTLGEWADLLRVVGNQGAHYTGTAVARADAEDAVAFCEALLDHLYVLQSRFNEFKSRRLPAPTPGDESRHAGERSI